MKHISLGGVLLGALMVSGCSFQNSSELLVPTAPGNVNSGAAGSTGSTGSTGGSNNTGGGGGVAAFNGTWASDTIGGLPLGNCSDVKWVITAQTNTSLSGTVTANCASGVTVSANLTGTLQSENVINLAANGTLTAVGVPCQFNLTGTGTRQNNDSMKVDYNGSYCLGTISGSETLRRFPTL